MCSSDLVSGTVEAGCEVTLKRGTNIYKEECNENGDFFIKGALLDEGTNIYTLEIRDKAGNVAEIKEKIRIIYSKAYPVLVTVFFFSLHLNVHLNNFE